MTFPMQPIRVDADGVVRFIPNAVVRYLLDNGGIDMNRLAEANLPDADRVQFAQLIGYSVTGFHELPYVRDDDAFRASALARELVPGYGACRDRGCPIHSDAPREEENNV